MPNTNIKDWHKAVFEELQRFPQNFALMSCFRNGKPTVAICRVEPSEDKETMIFPLFVAVEDDMILTDHSGIPATNLEEISNESIKN